MEWTTIASQIMPHLVEIGILILTGMLTYVGTYISTWLKKKTEALEDASKLEKVNTYMTYLDSIINTTVSALNGTMKAELIAASSDGTITKEEGQMILNEAKSVVNNQLSPIALDAINQVVGDLDQYIINKVEEILVVQKTK